MFWWHFGGLGSRLPFFFLIFFFYLAFFSTCSNMDSKQVWIWLTHERVGRDIHTLVFCMNADIKSFVFLHCWYLTKQKKIIYCLHTQIYLKLYVWVTVGKFSVCYTKKKKKSITFCFVFLFLSHPHSQEVPKSPEISIRNFPNENN